MYNNLDYRLNSLIMKYKIYGEYEKFPYKMKSIEIINRFLDLNKKILVVSNNSTDIEMFFSTLYIREGNNVKRCTYRKDLKNLEEYDQIWNVDLDWNDKKYALLKQLPQGKVINLYEFLSERGLDISWDFYNIYKDSFIRAYGGSSDNYRNIDWYSLYFYAKNRYDKEKTNTNLMNLIFMCLEIRDFEQAFTYIELSEDHGIISFKNEVTELLRELENKLVKRKNDIIINWIDALDYGSINKENMPYLYERQSESQCFLNAYASSPFTAAALNALFAHITMLDDEGYKMKKISSRNSKLIQLCIENGYIFRYYGMHSKSFKPEYTSTLKHYRSATTGQINWNVLCDMNEIDRRMVVVAHNMAETHPPFRSCLADAYYVNKESLSYRNVNLTECKVRGKIYVDRIIKWYNAFLVNEDTMVYLSDHGDPSTIITGTWRPHVNFFIFKKDLQPYIENRNFSMIDFDTVMMDVLKNKFVSIGDYTVEMAEIQNCDLYSKKRVNSILSPDKFDYEVSIGYRGVVTNDGFYMLRNDGVESYFSKFSCINTVDYNKNSEKVKRLRDYIIARNNDCKFKGVFPWTKKIYNARRKYLERIGGKERGTILLLEKLDSIADGKIIAIRGGGTHTVEMLNAIGNIGERISYIIDKDLSSAKIFKEFEVILPEQAVNKKIDVLIISSLRYREEFKQEALKYDQDIEVIDVYDMLESEGIFLERGFYEPNYIKTDFVE